MCETPQPPVKVSPDRSQAAPSAANTQAFLLAPCQGHPRAAGGSRLRLHVRHIGHRRGWLGPASTPDRAGQRPPVCVMPSLPPSLGSRAAKDEKAEAVRSEPLSRSGCGARGESEFPGEPRTALSNSEGKVQLGAPGAGTEAQRRAGWTHGVINAGDPPSWGARGGGNVDLERSSPRTCCQLRPDGVRPFPQGRARGRDMAFLQVRTAWRRGPGVAGL